MKRFIFCFLAMMMVAAPAQQVSARQRHLSERQDLSNPSERTKRVGGRLCQYLHEGWTFGQSRLPNRYPAVVPGVVHTDLMRQGLIDDPYFGLNERTVQWVDKEDWIYETTFCVADSLMKSDHIDLCLDGLDTYADVYLNDAKILEADNMFRRWRVSVKAALKRNGRSTHIFMVPLMTSQRTADSLTAKSVCLHGRQAITTDGTGGRVSSLPASGAMSICKHGATCASQTYISARKKSVSVRPPSVTWLR